MHCPPQVTTTDPAGSVCNASVPDSSLQPPALHILGSLREQHLLQKATKPGPVTIPSAIKPTTNARVQGALLGTVTKSRQGSLSKSMTKQGIEEDQGGFRECRESSKAGDGTKDSRRREQTSDVTGSGTNVQVCHPPARRHCSILSTFLSLSILARK